LADLFKVLAQIIPAMGTLTDAYTVPADKAAVISSIIVANEASSSTVFRISIAVAGAADDLKQYIYYDVLLLQNRTFIATVGLTLGAADVIRVQSANGNVAFNISGDELS